MAKPLGGIGKFNLPCCCPQHENAVAATHHSHVKSTAGKIPLNNKLSQNPAQTAKKVKQQTRVLLHLFVLVTLLLATAGAGWGQTIIWSEDFQSISNGATNGTGAPSGITTWNSNNGMRGYVDGNFKIMLGYGLSTTASWVTGAIPISSYNYIYVSIDINEGDRGTSKNGDDFIRCQFSYDGSSWTTFAEIYNDFDPQTVTSPALNGNIVFIRVQMKNDIEGGGDIEYHYFDNIEVTGSDMPIYCASNGTTEYDDGITLVNFGTINNSTGKLSGYNDYTSLSTDLIQGDNYNLSVNLNTDGNYINYAKAWIDWNHNGIFDISSNEEYNLGSVSDSPDGATSLSPLTVTVPMNASIGITSMRISTKYNSEPETCEEDFDGEVEDYTVNVLPSCSVAATYVSLQGTAPYCGSATITANGGSGGTIYFQGTNSGGTSTSNASTSEVVTSSGTYYFRAYNSSEDCWGEEGSATVTISDIPSAPTIGTITQPDCATSTGSVILNGLPSSGAWTITQSPGNTTTTGSGTSTTITGLAAGNTYTYTVASAGSGLSSEYYDNMTLTNPPDLTRIDATVNFDWGSGGPGSPISSNDFSVRWSGKVVPLYSETYTFTTQSDDGIRLWVDGTQIIDNWTDHAETTNNGTIALTAGQAYDIVLEFYENGGQAVIELFWNSASQPFQIIPQTQLYPEGTVLSYCPSPSSDNVVINSQPSTPVAGYTPSDATPDVGQTVTFTDNSTNSPDEWEWTIAPTSYSFVNGTNSDHQNPEIQFNTATTYTVSLTSSNECGSDEDIQSITAIAVCTDPTSGGTIAAAQTICSGGDPAAFTSTEAASGHTGTLEYKWQYSTTGPSYNWVDISASNSETFDDATTLTANRWYRRLARVDCSADWSGAAASNAIQVTVGAQPVAPGLTKNPDEATVCEGTTLTVTTTPGTGGTGTTADQYRYSTDNGSTWSSWSVTVTEFTAVIGTNLIQSRRTADGAGCNTSDIDEVSWTVNPIVSPFVTIEADPSSTICPETEVTFTATPINGGTSPSYQWKIEDSDVGSDSPTFITSSLTDGQEVTCEMTSSDPCANPAIATSNTIEITALNNTVINNQPDGTNKEYCLQETPASLSVSAAGSNLSYQWYSDNDTSPEEGDETAVGSGNNTYTPSTLSPGTSYYYCVVTGDCGTAISDVSGAITVYPESLGGTVSADQTICSGDTPENFSLSGETGNVVRWQTSSDAVFSSPTDINETGTILTGTSLGALTATTYVRALVQSGVCNEEFSNYATITVNELPNNVSGGFTGNTICSGENGELTFNANISTFVSTYTIEYTDGTTTWSQKITDSGDFTFNVAENPTSTTNYSLVSITNGNGCTRSSGFVDATAQITVETTPTAGSLTKSPDETNVCTETDVSATLSSGSGGNGTDELEYRTSDGTEWTIWSTYNSGTDISTTGLTEVQIRTRWMADYCDDSDYNTLSWTVNTLATINLTNLSTALCHGELFAYLNYSSSTGDTYSIDFNSTAENQGFVDAGGSLTGGEIEITVPGSAQPDTYSAELTVTNSTTDCTSEVYNITIIIHPLPATGEIVPD